MARSVRPARTAGRPPLGRDAVVRAAMKIADQGGLAELSMRRLAQELGVEAMSLYHYVKSKDDLLAEMIDAVHAEVALPDADEHWKSALRRSAVAAHDAFRRHRWVVGVPALPALADRIMPAQTARTEAMLGALKRAGLGPELTDRAYHALESHIVGFTLWQASLPFKKKGDLARLAASVLEQLSPEREPHVIEHLRWHLAPPADTGQTAFEFGLELILDGLERLGGSAAVPHDPA